MRNAEIRPESQYFCEQTNNNNSVAMTITTTTIEIPEFLQNWLALVE